MDYISLTKKIAFLSRPSTSPYLTPNSITERPAIFLSITRSKGALGSRSSVNSVQDHLAFPVSGSGGYQPFLFRKCHLTPTKISAMTFQNPLHAEKYRLQISPAFIFFVFLEIHASFPPRGPSRRVVVVIEVTVALLILLFWPPQVRSWLREVQQHVSLVIQLVATLAVELHFDGGTELWFAAYPGTVATEFGAVPLPAPARPKPQPHGTCHSLCGLTLVTLLEANVGMLNDFIRRIKTEFHISHLGYQQENVSETSFTHFLNSICGKYVPGHDMKACMGSGGTAPCVFKPDTR